MKLNFKDLFKNKWYIASLCFGVIALICLVTYASSRNFMAAMVAFVFIVLTVAGFYKGIKSPDKGATVTVVPPTSGRVNVLKIYSTLRDGIPIAGKISFENMPDDELIGNRWYFEDIHLWLHVMYNDINNPEIWKEFELPDEKYNHPGRLAWVLNQDDYEDFMRLELTTFEKLKPLLMLGANALVLFFIFLASG